MASKAKLDLVFTDPIQAFSTRLVAAAWWIFALAVFATYATTLKSFIAENFEPSAFHVATDMQDWPSAL